MRNPCVLRFLASCVIALLAVKAIAADQFFDGSTTNALTASKWAATNAGPFTSAFSSGNTAVFATVNGTGSGAGGITVAGIRAEENFTLNSPSGTLATGGTVATVNVLSGKTLDFGGLAISTAAGTGFVKSGSGTYATAGGAFTGGFTVNAGTMVLRGVNAMGAGGALTLNGGTIASNANRDLSGKYTGGITIGGNVQFGELATNVALANDSANLTFSNTMALGNVSRTLTLGNAGTVTFAGVISNTASNGVTFAATAGGTGRFDITNTTNTFTGPITITGGEARFSAANSVGDVNNTIVLDGGRFATANNATYTLASTHEVQVGDGSGTSISTTGTGTLTYNGVIKDKPSETGGWAKQGAGTLELGGTSTYTGNTTINQGTLKFTTGANRLPTGTAVSLGQASSTNLATLDLNGQNQELAGLNSISGTSTSSTNNNTITSTGAATLTLSGSGTYSYGDVLSNANSGIITGAIALVKNGSGTQTLGDANTYTGGTTINDGTLAISNDNTLPNSGAGSAGAITVSGGTLALGDHFDSDVGVVTLNSGSITGTGGNGTGLTATSFAVKDGLISARLDGLSAATLTKSTSGTVTLTGDNVYNGATVITGGTLKIAADSGLGTAPVAPTADRVTINGGALENSATMTLDANRGVALGSSGGTINTDASTTLTYNGVAAGSGALAKTGAGTLSLGGANTYNGATTITSGTLALGASGSIDSTPTLTVGSGTTFDVSAKGGAGYAFGNTVNGTGTVVGKLTLTGGTSHLAPGNSIGTMTISGDLTINDAFDVEYNGFGSGSIDLVNVSGALTLGGSSVLNLTQVSGGTAADDPVYIFATYATLAGTFGSVTGLPTGYAIDYAYAGNQIALVAVPEASAFLFGGLVAAIGGYTYRRRQRAVFMSGGR